MSARYAENVIADELVCFSNVFDPFFFGPDGRRILHVASVPTQSKWHYIVQCVYTVHVTWTHKSLCACDIRHNGKDSVFRTFFPVNFSLPFFALRITFDTPSSPLSRARQTTRVPRTFLSTCGCRRVGKYYRTDGCFAFLPRMGRDHGVNELFSFVL